MFAVVLACNWYFAVYTLLHSQGTVCRFKSDTYAGQLLCRGIGQIIFLPGYMGVPSEVPFVMLTGINMGMPSEVLLL